MTAFEYIALDTRGHEQSGVVEGDSPRHARQQLRDRGLTPVTVQALQGRAAAPATRRLRPNDLAILTRQMATLVGAATPLDETLQTVAEQSPRTTVRNLILGVRSAVMEGRNLADAFGEFPGAFPGYYRASVAAGEESGQLARVFDRLADYLEQRMEMRGRTLLALIYPILLTVVALGVLIALMTWVVPQVVRVFDTLGHELPLLTRIVMGLSEFMITWGVALLVVVVAAGAALARLLRQEGPAVRWDRMVLRLPLVGRIVGGNETARFSRTASILIDSGVPVVDALCGAREALHNRALRAGVSSAVERVREGGSLHRALAEAGGFPPITLNLIASGERGGRLAEMLDRAARSQEREVNTLMAAMLGVLEPALIVLVGGLVLIIVLAILLPVFELNRLIA
ncbi:MAG: type II secretion system protein GspF [Gammaproteobacteria bacterium]|nr:MAG: type II secretion system protein GspF [Gammaproteobacteria bacterium]